MKIKTSEAKDKALDYLAAKVEEGVLFVGVQAFARTPSDDEGRVLFTPTINWAQAGPIIEREQMDITWVEDNNCQASNGIRSGEGPTPLIAAMRCHVLMYLGDEVDVPEELIGE